MIKSIKNLLSGLPLKDQPKEFQALNILDSNIQELLDRVSKLEAKNLKYYAFAYTKVNTGIGVGATVILPLEVTLYPQYGNMHSNVNNNDKIYIRRSGVYNIVATLAITPVTVAGGNILFRIILTRNGGILRIHTYKMYGMIIGDTPRITSVMQIYCYAGDYIQIDVGNGTAAAIELATNATSESSLSVSERQEDLDVSNLGVQPPVEGE